MELRDARTAPPAFRRAANRISVLLAAEALRDLPSSAATVTTPLGPADGRVVVTDVVVVPVLRAGLGMLDAVLELLPTARVGHIGLQRDEATAIASRYYSKLPPDLSQSHVLMIDPMLATGGSAVAAIDLIKAAGATAISMICIVSAPEGVSLLERAHPDVAVYTPVVDKQLNAHKFIVPGLGDFGDRLYGTE
jgi:uracil phosphoribosyltransferase